MPYPRRIHELPDLTATLPFFFPRLVFLTCLHSVSSSLPSIGFLFRTTFGRQRLTETTKPPREQACPRGWPFAATAPLFSPRPPPPATLSGIAARTRQHRTHSPNGTNFLVFFFPPRPYDNLSRRCCCEIVCNRPPLGGRFSAFLGKKKKRKPQECWNNSMMDDLLVWISTIFSFTLEVCSSLTRVCL